MIAFQDGNAIAREVEMRFEPPNWPEDQNAHTFHEDKMTPDYCWIEHVFYLAESVDDCIARKLAARIPPEEEQEA